MVNVSIGPWPYYFLFCLYWLPIRWLRITVSKSPTNYIIQKTNSCWGSINAHFQNVKVTVSLALLLIKAAKMLVTHNSKHIPFQSHYLHYQKSLTLCWCSVKGGGDIDRILIANKCGQTSTMGICCSITLGFFTMQCPQSLTLYWCSVDAHF